MHISTGNDLSGYEQPTHVSMQLRKDTHKVHSALHTNPLTKNLLKPSILLKDYIFVLTAFHRFHESIESTIKASWGEFSYQPKSDLIGRDLASLGMDENPLEKPKAIDLPLGEDALFGLRYVIGGSALGAKRIRESLSQNLNLRHSYGMSFFTQLSYQSNLDWKDFKADLDANVTNYEVCRSAAVEAFRSMDGWLWKAYYAMKG